MTPKLRSATEQPFLKITGLSKRFGSVQALDQVNFVLNRGEVVALLGQNGAGKSTLAKILAGLVKPDAGIFEMNGKVVKPDQLCKVVAIVQQELSLIPILSAAENIFLGGPFSGVWTPKHLASKAKVYLEQVGLENLDPNLPVANLSLAEKQLVELARALSRNAEIVILDEPTAALSDSEILRVQTVIRSLAGRQKGIIFVTHRLSEVFEVADTAIVFQNGKSQAAISVAKVTMSLLIEKMLGRSLGKMFPEKSTAVDGDIVCEVSGLLTDEISTPLSFAVRKGEIIGLAGQIGCGMSSVLRCIAGIRPRKAGMVYLAGEPIHPHSIRQGIELGVAYCSSERRVDGVFMNRSIFENLTAPALKQITPAGFFSKSRQDQLSFRLADLFQIDKARMKDPVSTLSGGNQQKVTVGKWIGISPRLLLIEEPTRGVDVGARAEIYHHLRKLANDGLPIIFSSTDLQEILGFADVVLTFYRGQLVRIERAANLTETDVINDVTHSINRQPIPNHE